MTAVTEDTDYFVSRGLPNIGIKTLVVSCINTVDSGDTLDVDLSKYGGADNVVLGVIGFTHTTENSVVVQEQPTTVISGSTLTLTIGGASNNQTRHFLIFLGGTANP